MLNKIGRVLLGVLLVSLMVASIVYIIINNNQKSKTAGTITVIVNSIDDEVLDQRRVSYNEGDTLFEVLSKEYEITYKMTVYGHYFTCIKTDKFRVETDGKSSWIWFEVAYLKDGKTYNDQISFDDYDKGNATSGVDGIALTDGMIFAMNQRDSTHNASVFNHEITFTTVDTNLVFRIVVYSICGLFLAILIVYMIFSRKSNKPITIKELCILAFMIVILFVQEELLSFIPNFQFTFLLIAVYTKVFGFKKTSLIVLAHILLDNIFMGSVLPYVMIPMFLGYYSYMGLIYLVSNKSIWLITLVGVIGSLIYCYLFLIANIIFLDIDIFTYLIMDIPFEILLAASSAFTLFYLYIPISNKLSNLLLEKDYTNQLE